VRSKSFSKNPSEAALCWGRGILLQGLWWPLLLHRGRIARLGGLAMLSSGGVDI
jgi:hypothetical protein